ncbi:MAG: hypothetical protein GY863_19340 [bacterium]|nr:hypothetical protein [bacterium]
MRYIIKSIHVWSMMKTSFLFFFVFGILFDILYIVYFGLSSSGLFGFFERSPNVLVSIYFLFSLAVSFGVFMSIVFGVASTIFNLTSDFFGGIRICLKAENIFDANYSRELPLSEEQEPATDREDQGETESE